MSTFHRLDLQTLGSQPIMPKNLPDHYVGLPFNSHVGWNIHLDFLEITHFVIIDYGPKGRNTTGNIWILHLVHLQSYNN